MMKRQRGQAAKATTMKSSPINGSHNREKIKVWIPPLKTFLLSISLLSILALIRHISLPLFVDTPNQTMVVIKSPPRKVTKIPKRNAKTFYWDASTTVRPIVRSLRASGWQRVNDREDAHFVLEYSNHENYWTKLKPWQRISHIPGYKEWNRKDSMVDGFKTYQDKTGNDLFFLPDTYRLSVPEDAKAFERKLTKEGGMDYPWVLKEPRVNQGKGITFMPPNSKELKAVIADQAGEGNIIQQYICNEMTWNKRKFDVRMFWYVASLDPLIVMYHDGYARVGNAEYNEADFSNTKSHLTTHTGLGEEGKGTFDELRQRIEDHHKTSSHLVHIRDPIQHVKNQFKHSLSELVAAFKDLSFSPGDALSAENGLAFYGADFAVDKDLDVWLIEPQKGCGLDEDYHFRVEMHDQLFSGMVGMMEDVWRKQEAGEPLLPFQNAGQWEIIYADGWQYKYEGYERAKIKKQCGKAR